MSNRTTVALCVILLLAGLSLWIVLGSPQFLEPALFWQQEGARSLDFHLGLDLQGGIQVLLVADVDPGTEVSAEQMETTRRIVEDRINRLGLTEPVVQVRGERTIIVELPGAQDRDQAVKTIQTTALLEFIESNEFLAEGALVTTTHGMTPEQIAAAMALTNTPVYSTVMTGASLQTAMVQAGQLGQWEVAFQLKPDAAQFFSDYTERNIGRPLCIVLDKKIISCPRINSRIPRGEGSISGGFTNAGATTLAVQLNSGALPIPLRIESFREVGPSLGQESVTSSLRAGTIGLLVVLLFMLVYYRLNGLAADLALALYVLLNLLLYKLAPVTMTLPGIAGFLLSAGMAVDANILVFERMKEELRRGRSLGTAIEAGFGRAWTSVRDSNIATLLTCLILYSFGNAFAAGMVKGFAITLAMGTFINLFTAIFVTRTFVRAAFALAGEKIREHPWLLGI